MVEVPDNQGVLIIQPTNRGQIVVLRREADALDHNLVESELVDHLLLGKVPNEDVSVESGVSLLPGGQVLSIIGDRQAGDIVVMSPQEGLGPGDDVPYNDGRSQREDDVFVVRMQQQTLHNIALEVISKLCIPLKPITASMSK